MHHHKLQGARNKTASTSSIACALLKLLSILYNNFKKERKRYGRIKKKI